MRSKIIDGKEVIVDDEDWHLLEEHSWRIDQKGYVVTSDNSQVCLHSLVAKPPFGKTADHKDRDKLNNTRSNLRPATKSQNTANSGKRKNNTSGYKGVSLNRQGRWLARIKVDYKTFCLGTYTNIKDAAKAYNDAAKKYFGEFACLNEIE